MTERPPQCAADGIRGGMWDMNARWSDFRKRATFPVILIVLALGLGVVGWLRLIRSTPTPPELQTRGYITVYTSDPKASVSIYVSLPIGAEEKTVPLSEGETLPGSRSLSISLEVTSAEGPVWWAMALGEDARFPPGEFSASGVIRLVSLGDEPAYWVDGVQWPTRADPDEEGTGTVLFGKLPEGGHFNIRGLQVKMQGPLLQDVGEYVTLSTPTVGRPGPEAFTSPPSQIGGRGNPRQFYNGKANPRWLAMLSRPSWYEPERLQVEFNADFDLTGVRQEAGTTPVAPFGKQWQDKNTLKVEATFRRPAEAANNERWIFFAGVLVSLAASFLVWALELLLGPGRDPVAALRRRP